MKTLLQALTLSSLASVAGCPAPEALTSIDGLEGGALTSGVTAPNVAADTGVIGALTTTTTSSTSSTTTTLQAETSTLGTATSTSLTTETLTVSTSAEIAALSVDAIDAEAVTAVTVAADVIAADALRLTPTAGGRDDGSLIGHVVGAVAVAGAGYDGVDVDCFNAFAGSHVCGEVDVLHFLRSSNFSAQVQALTAAAIDGASFATATHAVVGFDGANQPIVADDCESWQGIKIAGEPPGLHARHVVDIEATGATTFLGRVSTSNSCAVDTIRVLCCGK